MKRDTATFSEYFRIAGYKAYGIVAARMFREAVGHVASTSITVSEDTVLSANPQPKKRIKK